MRRAAAFLVMVALASTACASYKGTALPPPRTGAMPAWRSEGAVAAGADPVVERDRQKAAFDADLRDERVLPIQVFLQNGGEIPLVVRRTDITLTLPDGREIAPSGAISVAARLDRIADTMAWGLAFGLIGALAAANAEEQERAARRADYQGKELREEIFLGRNDTSHGFVYFTPPRGTPPFDAATLTVRFIDPARSASRPVHLSLTGLGFPGTPADDTDARAEPPPPRAAEPPRAAALPPAPPRSPATAAPPSTVSDARGVLVGTWTGTLALPPRRAGDVGNRHPVTIRILDDGGQLRWEMGSALRGAGTATLTDDGIVLAGLSDREGIRTPITYTLVRRGRTLEGAGLGANNQVETVFLRRAQ